MWPWEAGEYCIPISLSALWVFFIKVKFTEYKIYHFKDSTVRNQVASRAFPTCGTVAIPQRNPKPSQGSPAPAPTSPASTDPVSLDSPELKAACVESCDLRPVVSGRLRSWCVQSALRGGVCQHLSPFDDRATFPCMNT